MPENEPISHYLDLKEVDDIALELLPSVVSTMNPEAIDNVGTGLREGEFEVRVAYTIAEAYIRHRAQRHGDTTKT